MPGLPYNSLVSNTLSFHNLKALKGVYLYYSLERRRAREVLIEVFKWVKGINKGNINQVTEFSRQDRTRGNGYKLEKLRFRTDIGRHWFTNRVVNDWNRLSSHVVSAESINR